MCPVICGDIIFLQSTPPAADEYPTKLGGVNFRWGRAIYVGPIITTNAWNEMSDLNGLRVPGDRSVGSHA
jgi:hypothetical protein